LKGISPFRESAEKSKKERKVWLRRRRRQPDDHAGEFSMARTAVSREQSAVGYDDPRSSRDEVLARYRQFREISKRHHHEILACISSNALLNQARRLGLARGKTLILEDMEEMNYVYDLAIHTLCRSAPGQSTVLPDRPGLRPGRTRRWSLRRCARRASLFS
jgi:hypothetical protein